MSALFAFLHHLAAFTLVAALVLEFALIKGTLTVDNARKIQVADLIIGIAAGAIVAIGLLRVFYFEKGSDYYFHSTTFLAKMGLFVFIALLSIYPTIEFISWRSSTKRNQLPVVSEQKMKRLRALIHFELVSVVFLILCAALMAKGI